MTPADRRAYLDYIAELPAQTRAALESEDFDVFCYYGFGVVPNDAQLESHHALREWPPGTVHLWRFANRVGKTSGLILDHMWCIWKKWRYVNEDHERWTDYVYRTLHAAPLNRLMGKAWEMADALINGSSVLQLDPLTHRQRPAPLGPFFTARTGKTPDGSESMWVECVNNGRIDFLSTHDGAARMESESWWLIGWDEFVRQAPVTDIPLLFDQTFLPRSSDYMAPVILSGTVTEDSDPIYAEIEDIASDSPKDWNVMSFDRSVNFSQSQASIDRQLRLSIDPSVARRSVSGQKGEGGKGALYPTFLLSNAFVSDLHSVDDHTIERLHQLGYEFISMFDHAATGDLNVVQTWAVRWPVPRGDQLLADGPILAVGLAEKRSGGHLTPTLQAKFAINEVERFDSRELIVDGTGEGGALVYNGLRSELAGYCAVVKCEFSGRSSKGTSNKEDGLQSLQRFLSWGLDYAADAYGWVDDWPEVGDRPFGIVRFPFHDNWRKLHRELAVLKRDDQHQRQDRAMTAVMGAWHLRRKVESRQTLAQPFSMVANRRRRKTPLQESMIVR